MQRPEWTVLQGKTFEFHIVAVKDLHQGRTQKLALPPSSATALALIAGIQECKFVFQGGNRSFLAVALPICCFPPPSAVSIKDAFTADD
ncbi:hypothetical protein SDC9_48839 [bioreactor metagenome]|uniref:Uncharacterized protein n=1 Tax=bioreactor metagenome TaxID=1076179 RepID=A0A644WFJ5_9ZZZZ